MIHRLRLLQGATALLYFGPLLAGLSGHGWAMAALFTAILGLWAVLIHPELWPGRSALGAPGALVAPAATLAAQALLVVTCFVIGRGFAGVMGLDLSLPRWFPAALSFLALPLSRLAWPEPDPGFAPLTHRPGDPLPEEPALLLAALSRLPDTASELELQAHLMASRAAPGAIRDALARMPGRVAARARIIQATDPVLAGPLSGRRLAAQLFPPQPEDIALFATRALRLLAEAPEMAADLPDAPTLARAAEAHPEAAPVLLRLAAAIRAASPTA